MVGLERISTNSAIGGTLPGKPDASVAKDKVKPGIESGARASKETMARELEATFLSLILKEMRQTLEPEGMFAGDSSDVQGGLFDLFLGKHLADNGGVGMADVLIRQLKSNPNVPDDDKTRNLPARGTAAAAART